MKGIGWLPLGSLEAEKNRKAMEIVSDKKYRQHPDKLKYSILMDSMNMVLATNNAKIMDEVWNIYGNSVQYSAIKDSQTKNVIFSGSMSKSIRNYQFGSQMNMSLFH